MFGNRHWRLPKAEVEQGLLARICRDGSSRGYPTASSVLPCLALHSWLKQPTDDWTPYTALSVRRIAALSGIDKNSVLNVALPRLVELGLADTRLSRAHARDGGNARLEYRLHRSLFPSGDHARYAKVTGTLVYGGILAMLPRASARHMLLAVMALDPVHDETLLAGLMADEDRQEPVAETLARRREADCEATAARLVEVTGLASSTAQQALDVLTRPIDKEAPLVSRTDGRFGRVYFFNSHALKWHWKVDLLNDRQWRRDTVRQVWGDALGRAA